MLLELNGLRYVKHFEQGQVRLGKHLLSTLLSSLPYQWRCLASSFYEIWNKFKKKFFSPWNRMNVSYLQEYIKYMQNNLKPMIPPGFQLVKYSSSSSYNLKINFLYLGKRINKRQFFILYIFYISLKLSINANVEI